LPSDRSYVILETQTLFTRKEVRIHRHEWS
jgi:hypothetical protein